MEKHYTAYNLETNMCIAYDKQKSKTLKCLIYAAMVIKHDAGKECDGETFVSARTNNIWITKESLTISFNRNFGYEFTYDAEKDTFKVSSFFEPYSDLWGELVEMDIKLYPKEMQKEIDNDDKLVHYIKEVIKTALMPADKE